MRALECGESYCIYCGDCLACYGSDPCIDGISHVMDSEDYERIYGNTEDET